MAGSPTAPIPEKARRCGSWTALAGKDVNLAKLVADYPWFSDGIVDGERNWLGRISAIAENDPGPAKIAAGYSR